MRLASRAALVRLGILLSILAATALSWGCMPGSSHRGSLPPMTDRERALEKDLRQDVEKLAGEIGERNVDRPGKLAAAADFLEASLATAGYIVTRQTFPVKGVDCHNLEVEIRGSEKPDEIVVVGAHYDAVHGCPAANDNGSGTAAVLALARAFAAKRTSRTLRFVLFVNEEPPNFQTGTMGSVVYAKRCKERNENVVAMLSLETIGYYSDAKGSQKYPFPFNWFYPSKGNFVGFVGNFSSRGLVRKSIRSFRKHAKFPSEGIAAWGRIPGLGWSDHWAFWQEGYPAIMVTDTAPYRYPHYHEPTDTPDKVIYDRMARVVAGLEKIVEDLADIVPQ